MIRAEQIIMRPNYLRHRVRKHGFDIIDEKNHWIEVWLLADFVKVPYSNITLSHKYGNEGTANYQMTSQVSNEMYEILTKF